MSVEEKQDNNVPENVLSIPGFLKQCLMILIIGALNSLWTAVIGGVFLLAVVVTGHFSVHGGSALGQATSYLYYTEPIFSVAALTALERKRKKRVSKSFMLFVLLILLPQTWFFYFGKQMFLPQELVDSLVDGPLWGFLFFVGFPFYNSALTVFVYFGSKRLFGRAPTSS